MEKNETSWNQFQFSHHFYSSVFKTVSVDSFYNVHYPVKNEMFAFLYSFRFSFLSFLVFHFS